MGLYNVSEVITNEVLSRHNVYGVTFDGVSSEGKPLYNAIDQKWVVGSSYSYRSWCGYMERLSSF